jgi:hypothetical protein
MRLIKRHSLLTLINSYLNDGSQPSNLSYLWNFGSLLAVCLIVQIITGVTLAMHYNPNVLEAFNSIEHIMRDVNNGWLIRYLHGNTASAFFFLVYLHVGRGIYYGSYRTPRTLVWFIGTIILVLMIGTGFLGYYHSPKWYKLNLFVNFILMLILYTDICINLNNMTIICHKLSNNSYNINQLYLKKLYLGKRYYSTNNYKDYNNNNKNNKTIIQRIIIGLKPGWNIPSLPSKVLKFHNYIFTRIFRVIGDISIVAFLSRTYINLLIYLQYLVLLMSLLHFSYILMIKIIKIIYGIKLWKSGKLDVRNSPFDKLASSAAKALQCWEFDCELGSAGLGLVGSSFLIDQILEGGGQEKIFTPLIGNTVKLFVNSERADILLSQIKQQTKDLENFKEKYQDIVDTLNEAENYLNNNSKLFTKEDMENINKGIKELKDTEDKKLKDLTKDLVKNISKFLNENK